MSQSQILYLWIAILCLPASLRGQQMERLTVDNGLSQGFILDALQTRSGFLWFATLDGLNRFDGISFEIMRPERKEKLSAPLGTMNQLLEDSRNFLWVVFEHDLGIIDQQTEQFYFLPRDKIPPLSYLAEDFQGSIWGYNESSVLYKLTFPVGATQPEACLSGLQVDSFRLPCIQETGFVYAISPMETSIWIGTEKGVYEVSYSDGSCKPVPGLALGKIQGIWRDSTDGAVWLFNDSRLCRSQEGKLLDFQLSGQPISKLKKGISNGRVTCFFSREHIYQWKDGQLLELPYHVPEGIISGCFDREGILWVGTNAKGIVKIPLDHFYFDCLGAGTSLNRPPLYDKDGQLWLSGFQYGADGYNRFDLKSRRLAAPFLSGEVAYCLFQARGGKYWFKSSEHELCCVERPGARPTRYKNSNAAYDGMLEDQQGRILECQLGGILNRFDPKTAQWTRHSFAFLLKNSKLTRVNGLVIDQTGRILIGTSAGLVIATLRADQSYDFQIFNTTNGLTDNLVLAILPDRSEPDICWLGTQHGLNKLNIRTGECRKFTMREGLPNDVICSIVGEDDHRLWLGTYFGLLEFDTRSFSWRHFTISDGLPCNEFNHQAALRLSDGRMLFGGVDGFTVFHPEDTRRKEASIPRLCLTGLTIGAQKIYPADSSDILKESISFAHKITLDYQQDNLFFNFALLDYFDAKRNHYFFRLRGLQKDWFDNGSDTKAAFFKVPPGDYVFEVYGINSAGIRSEIRSIAVKILKPWWRSWWAFALYAILLLLSMGILLWFWLERIRVKDSLQQEYRESQRLKELEAFKSRLFSNYTHEFRTPLAIIKGLADQAGRQTQGATLSLTNEIQQQADTLIEVTGYILDLAKLEEKKMRFHPEPIELTGYLTQLCQSYKDMANRKQIQCLCLIPEEPIWVEVDIARLRDIIVNLFSNAIKFTPEGGKITFLFRRLNNQQVQITIQDTGIGIAPEHLEKIFERFYQVRQPGRPTIGTGIGLSYVAEVTRAMGGNIDVSSKPGEGSLFVLTLPMKALSDNQRHTLSGVESPDKADQAKRLSTSEVLATDPALPLLLIVEDNILLTQVLDHYLSKYYRIVFAENGQKGLEKAQEQVPDIVICDLMMPEMDGFDFCNFLRANPYTSHIPVVILTAITDEESRIKVLEAGANVVITKPVNPDVLRQQLKNLLQLRLQMHALVLHEQETKNKAEHSEPAFQQSELIVMEKMMDLIAARYDDPNFSVADIQRALNFSKSQLHRKLVSISGYPGSHFIREYRLKEAKKLLLTDPNLSVADIAYQVGYTDPNYFSRAFSAEFGKSPSKIREIGV